MLPGRPHMLKNCSPAYPVADPSKLPMAGTRFRSIARKSSRDSFESSFFGNDPAPRLSIVAVERLAWSAPRADCRHSSDGLTRADPHRFVGDHLPIVTSNASNVENRHGAMAFGSDDPKGVNIEGNQRQSQMKNRRSLLVKRRRPRTCAPKRSIDVEVSCFPPQGRFST
jgi:hypothetical protein